jgi:hypothetical protein
MDINVKWVAKLQTAPIYKKKGLDPEKEWLVHQIEALTVQQREKWSIKKLRRYLLENFCHPMYVEEVLLAIMNQRYEKAMKTGIPPKYY